MCTFKIFNRSDTLHFFFPLINICFILFTFQAPSYDLNIIYISQRRINGNTFSETIELFRRQIFVNCMEYILFKCRSNFFCLIIIWNICFLIVPSNINILVSGNAFRISPNVSIALTVQLFVPASEHSFQLLLCSIITLRTVFLFYHTRPHVFIPCTYMVFSSQLNKSSNNYCRPQFPQAFQ